mmetsp:Transcript_31232/g.53351  ORF Transcript_31232/g.53351 Transcript_31232/m.53351 type:complete len:424 (+) Transcript_31232:375-1646(+)
MESTHEEDVEGQAIVQVLAVVLERLVSANSHIAASQQEETKFHAHRAPAIGILQYLERIHKYASCSKECFILALIYIDRLIQKNNFLLTELNVHRVVITAVLLAAKFFDDAYYNNAFYAKVGGVLGTEMNALECEFLFKIDFSLRVLPDVFDKYRAELISHSSVMGLNELSNCSDGELFEGVSASRQQEQQVQHVADTYQYQPPSVPAPQAPVVTQTCSAELNPVVYASNPAVAAGAPDGSVTTSHYPIQALHQSMTQLQVVNQHQPNANTATNPNLANQVSVPQYAQDLPSQYAPPAPAVAPTLQEYTAQGLQSQIYSQQLGAQLDGYDFVTPVAAGSEPYAVQVDAAIARTPIYAQHAAGASRQEITPSPSPPPQHLMNMSQAIPIGCSSQYVSMANTMPYLQPSTPTEAAVLHSYQKIAS